jgi:hypothetical protein
LASSITARRVLSGNSLSFFSNRSSSAKRVGRGSGEAGQHAAVAELADLYRVVLGDDVAERHLPVAAERNLSVAADAENGGRSGWPLSCSHRIAVVILHRPGEFPPARLPRLLYGCTHGPAHNDADRDAGEVVFRTTAADDGGGEGIGEPHQVAR